MPSAAGKSRPRGAILADFTAGSSPPGFTLTRASTATNYNSSGVQVSAAIDVARYNYNPATLALRGLRIEPAATNGFSYSEDLTQASWSKADVTITANSSAAPDGTTTMDLVTEGSAGTAVVQRDSVYTTGETLEYGVHMKRGNTDWIRIIILSIGVSTNRITAWFNLATGEVGTVLGGGAALGAVSGIEDCGNGIYRCIAAVNVVTSGNVRAVINSVDADGSGTRVNNSTYYLWGMQFIRSPARFGTSYIPATGASAGTRSADAGALTVSAGITSLRYRFDDGTTQLVSVVPGAYAMPVNLDRMDILDITELP